MRVKTWLWEPERQQRRQQQSRVNTSENKFEVPKKNASRGQNLDSWLTYVEKTLFETLIFKYVYCGGEFVVMGTRLSQRQCAWLLSSFFKEGEEQKEVREGNDDEEKESEVDGEVEKTVTQRVHETWRWPWDGMRLRFESLSSLEPWALVWCARNQTRTTRKRHNRTKGTHEFSVGVLVRVHMLHVCVHVKHVFGVIVNVQTYSLFIYTRILCRVSHVRTGLLRSFLYTSLRLQ